MDNEKVAVMRMLLYVGDRKGVEEAVANSIHGTRVYKHGDTKVTITAITIHEFPNVIEEARNVADPQQVQELHERLTYTQRENFDLRRGIDKYINDNQKLMDQVKLLEKQLATLQLLTKKKRR